MRRAVICLLLVGCSYKAPDPAAQGDGSTTPDNAPPVDMLPDPMICAELGNGVCLGNTLRECTVVGMPEQDTPCAICNPSPPAKCEVLTPFGGAVTATDLFPDAAILDVTIAAAATANSETGQITGVRDPGIGNVSGIDFKIVNNVGIWRFNRLTINGALALEGTNAVAFAAAGDITVNSVINARGACFLVNAGPGGRNGGNPEQDGSGDGHGTRGAGATNNASGGAGAGHGVIGSAGAASAGQTASSPGPASGNAAITTLVGGSGGGGGGGESFSAGFGGGGGGAVQLVANLAVVFGASGGINAGGCGAVNLAGHSAAGGGGGSGGTILLEAVAITLDAAAILAVNGGGGSGGDNNVGAGQDAQLSRTPAPGGAGAGGGDGTTGGRGGAGGAPSLLSGEAGLSGSSNLNGGGGGGAVGRIRINTRANANLSGDCTQCSPNFTDDATTLTRSAADIQ